MHKYNTPLKLKFFSYSIVATLLSTSCWATTKIDKNYPIPYFMDPYENKLVSESADLIYSVDNSIKMQIKVGNLLFSEKTFIIIIKNNQLLIQWPSHAFITAPVISFVSIVGGELQKIQSKNPNLTQIAIANPEKRFLNLAIRQTPFRICISEESPQGYQRLCSGFKVLKKQKTLEIFNKEEKNYSQVLIDNQIKEPQGKISIPNNKKIKFFSSLESGLSYEFSTDVEKQNFRSIYLEEDGRISVEVWPSKDSSMSSNNNETEVQTLKTEANEDFLFIHGQMGGSFQIQFNKSKIPLKNERLFLSQKNPKSTYSSNIKLLSWKPKEITFPKSDNIELEDNNQEFTWHFSSPNSADTNRDSINYLYKGDTYKAYYILERNYPSDLTARGSGIISSQGAAPLAELTISHWFESIFGSTNYWLSRQRWGAQLQYFQALSALPVDGTTTINLSSFVAKFKYRMPPGIWSKDEAYGPLLSYQNLTYGGISASLLGVGIFWGRMMPDLFESLIGKLPFLNYPKWVDLEVISYTSSMTSNITLAQNIEINFHGQVHWKKNFFGEAGFGYKSYNFYDSVQKKTAMLDTFYGLAGLGLRF